MCELALDLAVVSADKCAVFAASQDQLHSVELIGGGMRVPGLQARLKELIGRLEASDLSPPPHLYLDGGAS